MTWSEFIEKTGKFHTVVVGCGCFATNVLKNRNFVIKTGLNRAGN